ncbi:peroxidase 4-like [Malania oleifera]|uniref:peroxidase 4-like n=1 Tax=Malania oleifera TaxID=397392 RepID=UPI0025AE7A61|nr:peroxidase 4-like [Malania oleifera]
MGSGILEWVVVCMVVVMPTCRAQLRSDFYNKTCSAALQTLRDEVRKAMDDDKTIGAALIRLHYLDCFVNGCDGSILLDDTPQVKGEKNAIYNKDSARGFEVIDNIKDAVNKVCTRNSMSCADILAVAARDAILISGGPWYDPLLGRRDTKVVSLAAANDPKNLPPPNSSLSTLISVFQNHGMGIKELVLLSAAHTVGNARCVSFRQRIYTDAFINPFFAARLRDNCPQSGGDNNVEPLDHQTPYSFDNVYFNNLETSTALLHSDQVLYSGDFSKLSDQLVKNYSANHEAFLRDFPAAMINMGNFKPLITASQGEIRTNCRKIN